MKITVKYFASMRDRMGRSEQRVDAAESTLTVEHLWTTHLSDEPLPNNTLIAINMEYQDRQTVLTDGDEVAFFPPVTGG